MHLLNMTYEIKQHFNFSILFNMMKKMKYGNFAIVENSDNYKLLQVDESYDMINKALSFRFGNTLYNHITNEYEVLP